MTLELEKLYREYYELMNRQQFNEIELDYSILEKHKAFLSYMQRGPGMQAIKSRGEILHFL